MATTVIGQGKRGWKLRLGEDDKDTRGSDRTGVDILPARRVIVNVYQLLGKKGGKPKKEQISGIGKTKGKKEKKEPTQTVYGIEDPESQIKVGQLDGIDINKHGYPVYIPYDPDIFPDKTRKQYNHEYNQFVANFVNDQRRKKNPRYMKKETIENVQVAQAQAKKATKSSSTTVKSKAERIWDAAKSVGIKYQKGIGSFGKDGRYSDYNVIDHEEAILKAIKVATDSGRLNEVPPPIVAVTTGEIGRSPPQTYYIRNDLRESGNFRKKKYTKSVIRRNRVAYRKPISSHGKKRKVVMRRKGGKR